MLRAEADRRPPSGDPDWHPRVASRHAAIAGRVALAVGLVTTCFAPQVGVGAQEPPDTRVVVRGTLIDATSGQPIEGGVVSVPAQARGTLSRDDGTFELVAVPAGVQIVRVQRIGYAELTRMIEAADGMEPLRLLLEAVAVPVEGVDVTVDGFATVSGVVVDGATGMPMPGVHVWLPTEEQGVATDSAGTFHVPGVALGPSLVQLERVGYGRQLRPITVSPDAPPVQLYMQPDSAVLAGLPAVSSALRGRRNSVPTVVIAFDAERLRRTGVDDARLVVQNFTHTHVVACQGVARSHWCVEVKGRAIEPNVCIDGVPAWGGLDELQKIRPHELYLVEVYGLTGGTIRAFTHAYIEAMARAEEGVLADEPAAQRAGVDGLGWSNGRRSGPTRWLGNRC